MFYAYQASNPNLRGMGETARLAVRDLCRAVTPTDEVRVTGPKHSTAMSPDKAIEYGNQYFG